MITENVIEVEAGKRIETNFSLNEQQTKTLHQIAYRCLGMAYDMDSDFTLSSKETALLGSFMFGIEELKHIDLKSKKL
ncbi:hypothetical protein NV379_01890 [Paenibacillus sp. N1-5-1-14]|uniref:hypothetical protein n=1 Tax=Paenibacillus radicibacter TaxID=2972488 RepID=UPI0021594C61|nr:hypothetical protein [Paenibacillus radicibacter]MCR8641396.1 hypothetical protein [Paenibacillus radicibacter]